MTPGARGPVSGDPGNDRGEAAADISLGRIGRAHNIYMTAGDNNYTSGHLKLSMVLSEDWRNECI